MTNQQRQQSYRARQMSLGRKPKQMMLTDDEAYYLERVLRQMRLTDCVPAMMRNSKGQWEELDC